MTSRNRSVRLVGLYVAVHSSECAVLTARLLGVPVAGVRRVIQADEWGEFYEPTGEWHMPTHFGSVTATKATAGNGFEKPIIWMSKRTFSGVAGSDRKRRPQRRSPTN